jgi:hypothetical protein
MTTEELTIEVQKSTRRNRPFESDGGDITLIPSKMTSM